MSELAASHVATYDDGKFIRTAIVAQESGTSFDVVGKHGERLFMINVFVYYDDDGNAYMTSTDVIDVDEKFPRKQALTFNEGQRQSLDAGYLVCAYFRND